MPDFRYRAITSTGEAVSGELHAASRHGVVEQLQDRGLFPYEINQNNSMLNRVLPSLPVIGRSAVGSEQLVVFPRQLAVLLDSGVPLLRSLEILEQQTDDEAMQRILSDLARNVEAGTSFSEALMSHPEVFSEMFVQMVRAGEAGGMLDTIMDRLARFEETSREIRSKIRSATLYPAAVCLFAVAIVVFLLVWVLPTFESLFRSLEVPLPLPTRVILGISQFVQAGWMWFLGTMIAVIAGVKTWARTEKGTVHIDRLKLRMPLFGTLFRKVLTARFTRTLGTLLRSGLPILQALDIAGRTVGNKVLSRALYRVRSSISEGNTMHQPLREMDVFQPMVTQMIAVGEETGNLDEMLLRVAEIYESQAEDQMNELTSLLEPALIIVLGLVVGLIVMAMFFPMFHIVTAVG